MGEENVTVSPGTDLTPVLDLLKDISNKQGEIIEQNNIITSNQNKLIDYFIPSPEQIAEEKKKQEEIDKQNVLLDKEQKKLEEEIKKEEQEKYQIELDFQKQVTELLTQLGDNQTVSNEVSSVSSSTNFTILLIIIAVIFFGVMYKAIRAFI